MSYTCIKLHHKFPEAASRSQKWKLRSLYLICKLNLKLRIHDTELDNTTHNLLFVYKLCINQVHRLRIFYHVTREMISITSNSIHQRANIKLMRVVGNTVITLILHRCRSTWIHNFSFKIVTAAPQIWSHLALMLCWVSCIYQFKTEATIILQGVF